MGFSVYYGIPEGTPPVSLMPNVFIKTKDGELRPSPVCADDIAHVEKDIIGKYVKIDSDTGVQYVEEEDFEDFASLAKTCKRRKRSHPYWV